MKTTISRIRPNGSALAAAQQSQNREITLTISPVLAGALEEYAAAWNIKIEDLCEWLVFNMAQAGMEESEKPLTASALVSKGARSKERRMNPPIKSIDQAGTIPLVKPDARRALAADLSGLVASVVIHVHQGFACSLASCVGSMAEPSDFTAPPAPDAEAIALLDLRDGALRGVKAGHAQWLKSHVAELEKEFRGYVPAELRAAMELLAERHGLSKRDVLAELFLLALASMALQVEPREVETASARGAR